MSRNRVLGCVIGDAVGDAMGAALEFWHRDRIRTHPQGSEWISDMLPAVDRTLSPLGLWRPNPPKGTGTDDTRMSQIFVEAVIKYGKLISSKLLAAEYVDRYLNRDRYYPGYLELATVQFTYLFVGACGALDIPCPLYPGLPTYALRSGAGDYTTPNHRPAGTLLHPGLWSLLMVPTAGLLHPGDPEGAYVHAFELAYQDVGYAKDAVGLLAAMIAAGVTGQLSARQAVETGLSIDPFRFGEDRLLVKSIRGLIDVACSASSDREAVLAISRGVQGIHPYNPVDVLGMPVAACYRADGDPQRAILMAVNDRDLDDRGSFRSFRDIDCTGSICGALVGALAPGGISDFPSQWVSAVLSANKEVYGLDIGGNAEQMYKRLAKETANGQRADAPQGAT